MIEVSALLFSLLIEGLVALLVVLLAGVFVLIKRKRKDTAAAKQLVDQIKHQSDARIKQMGAYLTEKYQLEGEELSEAIKLIDKSEKRFFQRLINMYLKRDSESVKSIDAWLAELVETYKSFQPAQPDEPKETGVSMEEFQQLQQTNENLRQELEITKDTMGNMIAEFGNMFGGGSDTKLPDEEVIGKVIKYSDDDEPIVEPEEGFVVGDDFVVQKDDDSSVSEELEDDDLISDIVPDAESDMAAELMAEMDAELNQSASDPAADLVAELEAEVAMGEEEEASSEQYLEDELLAELGIEPELDSKPDTQEAADALVAELEAEIDIQEAAEVDDIFEQAQKVETEDEKENEDVTGIDIGSEEDIDKLLEDMDLSRDK